MKHSTTFFILLRDLTKDLQRLFKAMQKNIHDQVVEGVCEGSTVDKLLQENNLTMAPAIAKCRSKVAAKSIIQIL